MNERGSEQKYLQIIGLDFLLLGKISKEMSMLNKICLACREILEHAAHYHRHLPPCSAVEQLVERSSQIVAMA